MIQLERNRTKAVIILAQLILQILPNLMCSRVLKAKMIVEPARTIDEILVQPSQLIAGYNEQLLAARQPVEKREQVCLRG